MTFKQRAAAWLREPLLQFLLIGLVLYAVLAGRAPDPGEQRIVVDERVVSRLVERWTQSFRRAPSQAEIDGLISDHVKDEVYYREALRLGLDRDDEAVRRLMRNKLVATATSDAEARQPSDAELQALLDKNPAHYAAEARFDFAQIYLGDDSPATRAGAARVLAELERDSAATVEVSLPLPRSFAGASSSDVASQFGDDFATRLRDLRLGRWSGPVTSGLGLHLVKIARRTPSAAPSINAIRQRLENDWRAAALSAAESRQYQDMLQAYDVVIEVKP